MSLFRRSEQRALSYQQVWGSGGDWSPHKSAGELVNSDSALGLDAVWACVNMHAGMASALPLDAFRSRADGSADEMDRPPTLVVNPSLTVTPDEWVFQWLVSLMVWGNAYGAILTRDSLGYPATVEWLDPAQVEVEHKSPLEKPVYRVNGDVVSSESIWHQRWFVRPGSVVGLAPLLLHQSTFGLGLAAQRFGGDWFANGAHPSAVLETEQQVTQEQASAIKSRFKSAVSGREPVVMGAGMSYRQIQVSPNESQFLDTKKAVAVEVARIFGIQPEMIGAAVDGSSVTYANVEQRAMHYLTFGLDRWLVKMERALSRQVGAGITVKFNRAAILRSDLLTRYQAHEIGLRNGFLGVNEVRAIEDRSPMDEQGEQMNARQLAEALQKIYLSVGVVISPEEAREILNRDGAGLSSSLPDLPGRHAGAPRSMRMTYDEFGRPNGIERADAE